MSDISEYSSLRGAAQCAACAWRGACQKRFRHESTLSGLCADFSVDMTRAEDKKVEHEKHIK